MPRVREKLRTLENKMLFAKIQEIDPEFDTELIEQEEDDLQHKGHLRGESRESLKRRAGILGVDSPGSNFSGDWF